MEFFELIKHRRSIRSYENAPVPKEKLDKILMAGLLSPSGRALKPWDFIVVQDRATLDKLVDARNGYAKMLYQASCAIVVIANSDTTDVWTEDASIAMSNMHLMADNLGLGSCWIQGRLRYAQDGRTTEEYVRELLGFPENYKLEAILSIGPISQHPHPHTEEHAAVEKIHYEKF